MGVHLKMGDKMIEGKKPRIRYKSKILKEKGNNKKEVDPKEHSSQDQGKNKKEPDLPRG